jgi:hypothetical protein
MNLDEIKILIIEDEESEAEAIRDGLLDVKGEHGSAFVQNNIKTHIVKSKVEGESKTSQEIYLEIKEVVESFSGVDAFFIDLNLGGGVDQGLNIVRLLINSVEFSLAPKYVITGNKKNTFNKQVNGVFENADVEQYATIIEKPMEPDEAQYYTDIFIEKKLINTLPKLVQNYRRYRDNTNLDSVFDIILYKLDLLEILHDEDIVRILMYQNKILENLTISIQNVEERTQIIEIITKATAKALPKISDKKKIRELVEFWSKDEKLVNILGNDFPTVPNKLHEIFKDSFEELKDKGMDDFISLIYEKGKDYIQKQADIEKDDEVSDMLLKYSAYFIETVYSFVPKGK